MYCSPRLATYGLTLRGPARRLLVSDASPSPSASSAGGNSRVRAVIELTAALVGRSLGSALTMGAWRGGAARSASRSVFLAILDSGLSAVTVAGATLRLAT